MFSIMKDFFGNKFNKALIKTTHYRKIQKKVASPLNKTVHYGKREYDILRLKLDKTGFSASLENTFSNRAMAMLALAWLAEN